MSGRLLNASSSGGYVATGAKLPMMTRVHVMLAWGNLQSSSRDRIAAYVVRSDAGGVGLEWQEFAPPPLLALLDSVEVSMSPASPASIRTMRTSTTTR